MFSLPDCLSTYWNGLLTPIVDTYFLIFNMISSLSTFLFFGANILSLYLFQAKIGGKVASNPVIYAKYSLFLCVGYAQFTINWHVLHTLSTHLSTLFFVVMLIIIL